ncbi:MAG TPA: MMPL family transporter [Xanthomonadaceae bacterium]|nr:MMPL family transporter [Xanthomonadaceae bacterium]
MPSRRRLGLALLWLAALLVAGWWIGRTLPLSGDLRAFMPAPRTPAQHLLLDELGEGPGTRLLLVALHGAESEILAEQSAALQSTLAGDPRFALVANGGESGLASIPGDLRPYRYLLTRTFDDQPLDAGFLREQLQARVQDLASPAAALVEPLVPSDPTLETLALAEAWAPANAPETRHGVWFDGTGERALLLVQTRAAGFDPTAQATAVQALRDAFAGARGDTETRMALGGPGVFSVEIAGRTTREAAWLGGLGTLAFVLLLFVAYRSWKAPLFGALPLASGGLAGLGAVAFAFDAVHGITVAFGFTLIGVAQDYPLHCFSHQRPGLSPWDNVRALWPTLGTGVVATCIAYLTFLVSGVDGLQQLAVFTIVGLAVAALSTRFLLPALLDPSPRDPAESSRLGRVWTALARWPRPRAGWFAAVAVGALAVAWLAPADTWENDLSKLTPAPAELIARDARLRADLGAPDVRYMATVRGSDVQEALRRSEALLPVLAGLREVDAIDGFDLAARYLPSVEVQRARQAALPDPVALRATLDTALTDSPFRAGVFGPFETDVATARAAEPLRIDDLAGTPLQARVDGLLLDDGDGATALVTLSGLHDVATVSAALDAAGAELLDLKQASESLVAEYRSRVLWALALAALLLAATVRIALGDTRRALRVLAPMALTTLLVLAVLRAAGVELNLFHLVALILAAGLGLDYALFFDHAGDDRDDQLRTLHALLVCSASTLLVFALLASSSIPVLRAIGATVALGVLFNFVLALLIVRRPVRDGPAPE